jgi:HEAT repeat protein
MSDARVDATTPGSSSVEAYEEDWYRSLRALAERRASEFVDEEPKAEGQTSESAAANEETGAIAAASAGVVETETPEANAEGETPGSEPGPMLDIWAARAVEAEKAAAAQSPANGTDHVADVPEAAEETDVAEAVGPIDGETGGADLAVEGETLDARETSTDALGSDELDATPDDGADAGPSMSARETTERLTSPWARVLRPLERIHLTPRPDTSEVAASGRPRSDDAVGSPDPEDATRVEGEPTEIENDAIATDAHASVALGQDVDQPTHRVVAEETGRNEDVRTEADDALLDADAPDTGAAHDADGTIIGSEGDAKIDDTAAKMGVTEAGGGAVPDLPAAPFDQGRIEGDDGNDAALPDAPSPTVVDRAPDTLAVEPTSETAETYVSADATEPVVVEDPTDDDNARMGASVDDGSDLETATITDDASDDRIGASAEAHPDAAAELDEAPTTEPENEPAHGVPEVEDDGETASEPEVERDAEHEPEAQPEPEAEPEGPSLTSRDPAERRTALEELAEREATAAELETVAALILDPDAAIRRLAVETLARTPPRLEDAVVRQALQDPADEVRAAAVRAAATRGIRDLPTLAPLVDTPRSPETHRTVLELLPKILGEAQLTSEALDPLLLAVALMQRPPDESEREAFAEIAASIGTTLLIEGLMLPDVRRLGAVRLLAGDRSHAVLHALADRAGDPLEEVRQAGLAAADEIARIEAQAARAAGPRDIGALAEELRSPDGDHVERARSTLAEVDRPDVVTWCRERLVQGDAESVAFVASVAAVLDLSEIGVELLTRGASLPSERRRSVIEALAEFADPPRLAGYLAVVPPERRADAVRLVWEASGRRVLPDLRSLLADPVVEVRVAVIEIARDADDPASIEAVAGLLATDASPEVRAAAVRTIATTEGALPNVIRALGDPDPHVRATAVESMPSSPAAEVGPVLAQALSDLDEGVRLAAIERLAGVSSDEPALAWSALRQRRVEERTDLLDAFQRTNPSQILEIALEHLYSPDQDERTLAVEMTGWGASQAAVESAIRALGDPVPEVRRAAVAALGRLRDRSAVQALGKTLADPDADVRVGAVRALGVIDDEGVLAFLVAALKDPDQRVRETTSHVLTEWSSPAVAKRLAGVLAVPSLRDSAADLLRRIGPTSVELLIDVLLHGNSDLRPTVGPLLEQIIGIDEFLGRIDSLEPERRLRAIEALGAIGGPLAVDALVRSLSDPDERIRLRATQLLGELGDALAADAVRQLVDDPVPEVAAAARHALETALDSRGLDRPDYA